MNARISKVLLILVLLNTTTYVWAWQAVEGHSRLATRSFRHAAIDVEPLTERFHDSRQLDRWAALSALGIEPGQALLDERSGRWASLWLSQEMMPEAMLNAELFESHRDVLTDMAWQSFTQWLRDHRVVLDVDAEQLSRNINALSPDLMQIHAPRQVMGLPVRGAAVMATINHGKLILFGTSQWADITIDPQPDLTARQAFAIVSDYMAPDIPTGQRQTAELQILPMAIGLDYSHRLVWVITPVVKGRHENFEALVDAHSGELLAFEDTNHYGDQIRNVNGGVYPVSNDGMAPDGNEMAGYPMPFAEVNHGAGASTADSGGNVTNVVGVMSTALTSPFIRIDDSCGAVDESSTGGDLDLGVSSGTDCATPTGASAGNTHAARTAFYQLNRMMETARGQLPTNNWAQSSLNVQVNLPSTCNAFWTGSSVQMFRSAPAINCANLGELAGVLNHEWGHGMDDNGTNSSVSSPGEGIADVFAALRINQSCPGRGALVTVCDGFGDPCAPEFGCTAARDIDWERHVSQQPHNVAWVNANCGNSPHCRGMLSAESIWDLYKRDLPGVYGFDNNTALEIATRLTYLGTDNVATWNVTNNGEEGGCAASSGYQQFLAADDDNGNLNDGTPHMQAIFDAFNRHGIACTTPSLQDSGCASRPATAPVVTAIGVGDTAVQLNWTAVANATRYKVFRTEGEFACDYGKVLAGEVATTAFSDSGLQNGREYYYVVAGLPASDSCMGPASTCVVVTAGTPAEQIFADGFEN